MDMNLIDEIVSAVKNDKPEKNHTHSAVVSRIDDEGVVWVTIAGSEIETPTAETSAEVKKGDRVNVDWRNNKLYISGNVSNPSAGVTRVGQIEDNALRALSAANSAEAAAASAQESAEAADVAAVDATAKAEEVHGIAEQAIRDAQDAAGAAQQASSDAETAGRHANSAITSATAAAAAAQTAQDAAEAAQGDIDTQKAYFWHDDTGAHVRNEDTDYQMNVKPDGMSVQKLSTGLEVASFGADGAIIGDLDKTHVELGADKMELFSANRDGSIFRVKNAYDVETEMVNTRLLGDEHPYLVDLPDSFYDRLISFDTIEVFNRSEQVMLARSEWDVRNGKLYVLRNPLAVVGQTTATGVLVYAWVKGTRSIINMTLGKDCTNNANYTVTVGEGCFAGTTGDVAIGYNALCDLEATNPEGQDVSVAIGIDVAASEGSVSIGKGVESSMGDIAIGRYNRRVLPGTRALAVGNGMSDTNRSNAFEVDWDGNVTAAGKVNGVDMSKVLQTGQNISVGTVNGVNISQLTSLIKTKEFSVTYSVGASSNVTGTLNVALSGYTPIAVAGYASGEYRVFPYNLTLSGNTLTYRLRNTHTAAQSGLTFKPIILYVRNGFTN